MEGDLDKLADLIFRGEVKEKSSIHITGDFDTTIDLFEALLMLFTKGMRTLFVRDEKVIISSLTEDQFDSFKERFRAIGIVPDVTCYHIYQQLQLQGVEISDELRLEWEETSHLYPENIPLATLTNYNTTNSDKLDDFYFQFQSESNFYVINFRLELVV